VVFIISFPRTWRRHASRCRRASCTPLAGWAAAPSSYGDWS